MAPRGMAIDRLDTESAAPEGRAAPVRTGAIILARHGEPALSRRCRLTSDEYRAWWATYEEGGLLGGQTPPDCLRRTAEEAGVILASSRRRATETAAALAGDREVVVDALFIEAPLPPPAFPNWFKLSPRWWGVAARIWWWAFNHHEEGEETVVQARARAARAAEVLIAHAGRGEDVLVLAHGYFNHMVGLRLKAQGWRCVRDQGFRYWSSRRFEKR